MQFSVIIPIFNAEKTLEKCLQSVQNQSFSDFEVIMVDDGSSDRSRQIAEKYAQVDSRFHYLYQNNSGVSCARNLGISMARAEYITFLDSDDIYYSEYLASFMEMIKKYPGYGHYWCAFEEIDENGKRKGNIYRYEESKRESFSGREFIMSLHSKTLASAPWNKVYRREITQRIQMRSNLSLGEDEVFNFEYLDKCPDTRIMINNIPQYGYLCVSQDSLNTKYRENLLEIYEEMNHAEEAVISRWLLSEEQNRIFEQTIFYRFERVLCNTFHEKSCMTRKKKFQFANKVIRTQKFQRCLRSVRGDINALYYIAYRLKKYEIIRMLNMFANCKATWKKKK